MSLIAMFFNCRNVLLHQMNTKKVIFTRHCFLFLAGVNGHGLEVDLKKLAQLFQVLTLCLGLQKSPKEILVSVP